MIMIAVYVNEQGEAATLGEKGFVRVYDRLEQGFRIVCEISFDLEQGLSIAGIRRYLQERIQLLKECKVFVANQVLGQLYYVLEAHGFESFEAEGKPEEFLDSIYETMQREPRKTEGMKAEPQDYFELTEEEGVYLVNLKTVLNLDCSLTSKKLLLPFLRKKDYKKLKIVCDHIPKWFATELAPLNLVASVTNLNEKECLVIIDKE